MRKTIRVVFIPRTDEPEREINQDFDIESLHLVEYFELKSITNKKSDIQELHSDVIKNINSRANTIGIVKRASIGASAIAYRNIIKGEIESFKPGINFKTDIYNREIDDELLDLKFFDKDNLKENWHLATFECKI